jgi:hypothetical protein
MLKNITKLEELEVLEKVNNLIKAADDIYTGSLKVKLSDERLAKLLRYSIRAGEDMKRVRLLVTDMYIQSQVDRCIKNMGYLEKHLIKQITNNQ